MEDFTSNKQKEAARKLAELDQDDLYLREMESKLRLYRYF